MKRFYGIYLKSEAISTVLDLIRFIGEPDAIRLSHITLRGPYTSKINPLTLRNINENPIFDWTVTLLGPRTFFSTKQSTVLIAVDLGSLDRLVYKPDFPDSLPHITLYDGPDRNFASSLYDLLSGYVWERPVQVSRLREVARGDKIDQLLLPIIKNFYSLFQKLVGAPEYVSMMRDISLDERLSLIANILERCSYATPLPRAQAPLVHNIQMLAESRSY